MLKLTRDPNINTFINQFNLNNSSFEYPDEKTRENLGFQVDNLDEFFFSFWNRNNRGVELGEKLKQINNEGTKNNFVFLKDLLKYFMT